MHQIRNVSRLLAFTILALTIGMNTSDLHEKSLLSFRGSYVVRITNKAGTSGGTGFHIDAPTGQTYIMTNAHVCGLGKDTKTVFVARDAFDRKIERRIIEVSEKTDLCLVEALPGESGLKLSWSEPTLQETLYIIGHPLLYPLTLSKGRVIEKIQDETVLDHIMDENEPDSSCALPKNQIRTFNGFFGPVKACLIVIPAYVMNAQILPGNSGSPVFNKYGRVVAVVFAGDGRGGFGACVTHEDIVDFLKYY